MSTRVREPVLFLVIGVLIASLMVFVVYPSIQVFLYPSGTDFIKILMNPRYQRSILNSLYIVVLSTLSATFLGFIYAYAITRTDIPFRKFFKGISLLPLFSPPFMVAFSYIMLFGKNGLITSKLLGLQVNIFGWHGLWFAQTVAFLPVASLVMEGVLQSIPPSLEYAGRNLGASGFTLFRTITFPLARPGVAGAALLVAIQVLADFGNPIMISGDFSVVATEAWMRVEGWADIAGAAVLSLLLLVPSFLIFLFQRYWVSRRSYVTITGKITQIDIQKTGTWIRWVLFLICFSLSLLIILVYLALFMGAFVEGWGFNWTPTLRYVQEILSRSPELTNSLLFSIFAGAGSAVFSITAAYIVSRKRFFGRRFIDFTCILPAALPGIFLGLGYSISYTKPPFDLYGTAAIVVLALMFWNIAMGYQTGIGVFQQISPSLSEAASNLGAGSLRIFREIEIPLIKGPFFSAFIVSFIRAITTLSVVVFIVTQKNVVTTFSIMNLVSDGFYGKAAALTCTLLIIAFGLLGITKLVLGKNVVLFKV
ncbi:MAG: iron ABC transporter permease [Spirochaetes bacterium]|nr:iron ABC transporter permease [Spirochaetota bacterium]